MRGVFISIIALPIFALAYWAGFKSVKKDFIQQNQAYVQFLDGISPDSPTMLTYLNIGDGFDVKFKAPLCKVWDDYDEEPPMELATAITGINGTLEVFKCRPAKPENRWEMIYPVK